MTDTGLPAVAAWIWLLRAITAVNVSVWLWAARRAARRAPGQSAGERRFRRRQLALSALFVGGCAFRSILPRADVQRICLFDTWLSAVVIGRAVATVAEMAFMAQWAVLLGAWSRGTRRRLAPPVSRFLVPVIGVAELCSWYAVWSTNFLGNAVEQSIWTVASAFVLAAVATFYRQRPRFVATAVALMGAYLVFMAAVDVPMYLRRWRADQRDGRVYLTFAEGVRDATVRRPVTYEWNAWRPEAVWMSLYFSTGVWVSLWLGASAPAFVSSSDEKVTRNSLLRQRI